MEKLIYLLLIIVFLSCQSRTNYEKPKDLIEKDQMIKLLIDMHIVNGVTGISKKDGSKANDYMTVLYEKYQIDSTQFAQSNLYYISNISEYEKMFKEVEKILEDQLVIYDPDSLMGSESIDRKMKIAKKRKKYKDSIRK